MVTKPETISTRFFDSYPRDQGLILDYSAAAQALPEGTGKDYVPATDWRLRAAYLDEAADVAERRRRDAETRIIAYCDDEPQEELPDITCNALVVKKRGDMHLALPDVFDFALSRVHASATDLLQLYGPKKFQKAELSFIVQRTDVEPEQCHRPHISNWHDHVSGGQNMDFVYLFHNILGTENRLYWHNGEAIRTTELIAPDHSVSRVGGEIIHRPQVNHGATLRREWGALMVNLEPSSKMPRHRSTNRVRVSPDNDLFAVFKGAADEVLDQDNRLHALPESQTLVDYHMEMSCA